MTQAVASPTARARLVDLALPPLVTMVRACADGPTTWQPADTGTWWLLVPVLSGPQAEPWDEGPPYDIAGNALDIVDLLAWRPDQGPRLRLDMVSALGEWCLPGYDPIYLHSDPIGWLRARSGAYIIDWRWAADRLLARDVVCDTLDLAETVERHTRTARGRQTPPAPRIGVAA
jgi:hypothetical protein